MNKQTYSNHDIVCSPADRGIKKHVYFSYRGAISFWFYLIPTRLVRIFLKVVRVEISCCQHAFCRYYFKLNCITVKKGDISSLISEKNKSHHLKARKKLNIRDLHSQFFQFLVSYYLLKAFFTSGHVFCAILAFFRSLKGQ